MKTPLVSVLICTYNAESFVKHTLSSVFKQTYKDIEVLVLDNGSQDKTLLVLRHIKREEMRLKLFSFKENCGAYPGLNYLLDHARGQYIAINDHDDIWHPNKLKTQIDFLEKHKEYIGCGTSIINYYEKYNIFLLRKQPEQAYVAWHTSFVFRNTGKRYDTSFEIANDFYFMKHILCQNEKLIYNIENPHVLRKIREGNKNLSSQWITKNKIKDILRINISLFDKLALLNRLIMPSKLIEYLSINVLLRKNVISEKEMRKDKHLKRLYNNTDDRR